MSVDRFESHLDYKVRDKLGHGFYRVDNDVYGNPRYVIHWLAFVRPDINGIKLKKYPEAKRKANSLGFKVYKGKDFGGGFVCQSYNLENTAEQIMAISED